ncbi:AIR synthase-related protein, partial [Salmonella enterica]|uniref:AIR synthase-related protein n=1 Tax=Salmonella enterica TaxID=28901 RepID=UPI00398C7599
VVGWGKVRAWDDGSDGGLGVRVAGMACAGHCGVQVDIAALGDDHLAALVNEELGGVSQVRAEDRDAVEALLAQYGLADCVHYLGQALACDPFVINATEPPVCTPSGTTLPFGWAETRLQMQRRRARPQRSQ